MGVCARRSLRLLLVAVSAAGLACRCAGGEAEVDLWRILQQHRPTIVTTESAADLQRIMLTWEGVPELRVMPISEFPAKKAAKGELPPDGDVLFVIDRSKKELITPEIEALLPFPTSAIGSDEVLSYVSKTAVKRSRAYGNGWEILVSSPDARWLIDELGHAPEVFKVRVNEKTPTKLHWFRFRKLHVVSTEGQPDWLMGWVKRQQARVKLGDVLEAEVIDVESWDPATANAVDPTTNNTVDLMFLLNRNKLGAKESAVLGNLPQSMQSWWGAEGGKREVGVQRQVTPDSGGRERVVGGIVAPCSRHLELALRDNPVWGQIAQTLQRKEVKDLTSYPEIIVVPRTSRESSSKEGRNLSDFCSKMATALGRGTGFRCSTRVDLKDVIYTAVEAEAAGRISSTDVEKIRGKAPGAMALLVADLVSLDERIAYEDNEPTCVSDVYPKFDKSKPSEPSEPKPDDRKTFGGHIYDEVNGPGTRAQDPDYIRDHNDWANVKMPKYREDIRKWEQDEREYERKRQSHEMYWEVSADQIESVRLSGNLRVYDIRSADIATGGELVYSSSLTGEARQRGQWRKDRARVIGEASKPDTLQKPEPKDDASPTLRSKAFEDAAARALEELGANAILPGCGEAAAAPGPGTSDDNKTGNKETRIAVEGKGSVVLSQAKDKPAGKQLDDAKKAALTLALQEIMDNAKRECPTFAMSEEEVRENAVFVKDHWDARLKVYTARFSLTVDQAAGGQ